MNCEWVNNNLALYLYDELGDGERHELEQHVARCAECQQQLEEMRVFQAELRERPVPELTPNLLAAARLQLGEALETVSPRRGWQRLIFDPVATLRQLRVSPALASAIFLVGFGAGIGAMYQIHPPVPASQLERHKDASVAAIRSVISDPSTGRVEIEYESMLPEKTQGSVNDPQIQELLLMATRTNFNSGVRLDSIDLLKQKPDDGRIREGLVFSLRYDSNPGVRLKALEALQGQVKQDVSVRSAMLEALLNDNNPGVRIGALHALEAVKSDTSVQQALKSLSQEDPNPYIRHESLRILGTSPEME
jgi:hypothetical protein